MPYVILLFVSFFTHFRWINNLAVLTSGDWTNLGIQTLKEYLAFPYLWVSNGFGSVNIGASFYPFNLIYGILAHFNLGYGLDERLVFFWPILILLPISIYILVKKITGNTLASLIGSIIYSYNTYFFELQTGQLTLLMACALCPLVFSFFIELLETKKIKYSIYTAIVGFIVSFYEFRMFYILCWILFFYLMYYIILIEKIQNKQKLIKIVFLSGLSLFIIFLLNFYWIIGLSKTGTLTSNAYFNRILFGDEFLNINYAITLFHPFWTGTKTAVFIVQNIPFYVWIIPIFAFLGLYLNRKNKQIVFFGFISLLGVFLTKQVAHPFIGIYPFLYKYLPGFNAFREASKFYFLIALGYSILIPAFLISIWKTWNKNKWQNYSKYIITVLITLIFLWNIRPIIAGDFQTIFTPRKIPNDYVILNNFILDQNQFFRTLWMPTGSRWSTFTNINPQVNDIDEANGNWNIYIKNHLSDKFTYGDIAEEIFKIKNIKNLLDESSIKYIIIPLEDKENDDNFFPDFHKPRADYIKELNSLKNMKPINIGTKELIIYENISYKPHIYLTNKKETIKNNLNYKTVQFQYINPTEYDIQIKNINKPFYLNFTDSFNPSWKVRVGKLNWLTSLINKNYFISSNYHSMTDTGYNSFLINPKVICKTTPCKFNKNGTYDLNLTLYFSSQSYTYFGIIISSLTAFTILGYLIFIILNNIYEKNN